ncbi:MAG: dihydrodipicolinate synthase family protein [Cloacibacillus sp.]
MLKLGKLCGVFAPVPTPFHTDETLDLVSWEDNLFQWKNSALDGIVIAGSNGEMPFIDIEERVKLTQAAAKVCRGVKHIMTGAYFASEAKTVEAAKRLADAGADSLLLLPPHYFKGNNAAILKFYLDVADNSPLPLFLYNMPKNTGVDLTEEVILQAAAHPNIHGIKDTSGDMSKIGFTASKAPKDFAVFGGTGNWFLAALSMGACGGTMAVSILFPRACRRLYDDFCEGRLTEALEIQKRLLPVSDVITRRYGVPGLKHALARRGMAGGSCRRPLLPITDEDKKTIDAVIEASGLADYEK